MFESLKHTFCIAAILIGFGIVGEMDYQDQKLRERHIAGEVR